MKALDQDYAYTDLNNKIKLAMTENKQVKAMKAKLLSTESLQRLAQKHKMKAPDQNQLIIIK
jgi:cell division protein FtsL